MSELSKKAYDRFAKTASRWSPTRDADFLHAAWLETGGRDARCLLGRAKRRALDERRRQKRHSAGYYRARCEHRAPPDPTQQAIRDETRAIVRREIARLPPAQATTIYLRFWQGLSPKQIARRLRIPLATVYSRLRLATAKLAEQLRPYTD